MANRNEFAAVMAYMGSAVGKEPSREQAEVYFDLLGDLTIEVLRIAAKRAVIEHQINTIPPAGLIRQHAATIDRALPTPIAEGWAKVRAFAQRWEYWLTEGHPTDPKTIARMDAARAAIPPIALAAAEAYGWRTIIAANPEITFAHFRQLYESLDRPARQEAALPPSVRVPAVTALTKAIGQLPEARPALKIADESGPMPSMPIPL